LWLWWISFGRPMFFIVKFEENSKHNEIHSETNWKVK
jgi:hypothetical protein